MQLFSENRRARFDYDFIETYRAGLELEGNEVKSVRSGKANLSGSYALIRGGEAWLVNADIPPYQPKNAPKEYGPARTRRLLLHKQEISALTGKLHEKGLSLVALKLFGEKGFVKIELALARARNKKDKRDALKKRATEREMRS